jgi:hypothetical protein
MKHLTDQPIGYRRYDEKPEKYIRSYTGKTKQGKAWSCDVGYERFLGPEIFFNPEILRYLRWWCVARGAARS